MNEPEDNKRLTTVAALPVIDNHPLRIDSTVAGSWSTSVRVSASSQGPSTPIELTGQNKFTRQFRRYPGLLNVW